MSRWPGCGGAAESRRGEVAPVLRDMEQKNVIHTLNQSVSYSLIVGSVHMGHKGGVKKHPSRGGFLIFLCFKFLSIKMAESSPGLTYAKLSWLQAWHIRDETYSGSVPAEGEMTP
ncbi:hypothetical protein LIW98_004191 [Escherichia coli]|nr:hypothetical protein [Escherichia coli]